MTIYLSGPMTGYPHYNKELFGCVHDFLERHGHSVIAPLFDFHEPEGLNDNRAYNWWLFIRRDLDFLST